MDSYTPFGCTAAAVRAAAAAAAAPQLQQPNTGATAGHTAASSEMNLPSQNQPST